MSCQVSIRVPIIIAIIGSIVVVNVVVVVVSSPALEGFASALAPPRSRHLSLYPSSDQSPALVIVNLSD
jgi:hypothetical protein